MWPPSSKDSANLTSVCLRETWVGSRCPGAPTGSMGTTPCAPALSGRESWEALGLAVGVASFVITGQHRRPRRLSGHPGWPLGSDAFVWTANPSGSPPSPLSSKSTVLALQTWVYGGTRSPRNNKQPSILRLAPPKASGWWGRGRLSGCQHLPCHGGQGAWLLGAWVSHRPSSNTAFAS